MSGQQQDKFMGHIYKTGGILLLGVCAFFCREMASDFNKMKEVVVQLQIDFSGFKGEFGEFKRRQQRFQDIKEIVDQQRFKELKALEDQKDAIE